MEPWGFCFLPAKGSRVVLVSAHDWRYTLAMGRNPKFAGAKPARVNIYMHPSLLAFVRAQAKTEGITIGDWISGAVDGTRAVVEGIIVLAGEPVQSPQGPRSKLADEIVHEIGRRYLGYSV